ncbi:MAG: aldo/keto reductase [Armatimonadota bacterium]|nr:aldo/keto reductase [Armatimonadota bacterium]
MQRRALGRTGTDLSVVGFGGILVRNETPAEASRLVGQAIDRGINYFDVAPSYGDAEERLGPALAPYRGAVFLACKTQKRRRDEAAAELRQSLRRLGTDHVDLYQHHAVTTLDEVEQILAPGGAMEAFLEARAQGLIRLIGFSAHSDRAALALLDRFPFDSILFPLNWVVWFQGHFGPRVVDAAVRRGVGILALKSLGRRRLGEGEARVRPKCWYAPVESYDEAALALRFTLSLPVTAAVSPGHADLFTWMCDAADRFSPLSPEEIDALRARSAGLVPIFRSDAA